MAAGPETGTVAMPMKPLPKTTLTLGLGILLGVAFSLTGPVLAGRTPAAVASYAPAAADLARLADLLQRVRTEYVDDVDDHELMDNALRGLVAGLDDYSEYLDADEYAEMQASTSGHYTGIGVEVAATGRGLEVLRPLDDSPAARAGIRRGDLIVRIDGEAVADDADGAIERMRGPAGSRVRLGVQRDAVAETLDVAVERAAVDVQSATAMLLEPGYAYLRLTAFNENTVAEVAAQLDSLLAANAAPLHGLVLDLRNNPGGVLDAAVDVADQFLERGVIVTAQGRTPDARFRLDATPGDRIAGAHIAVLVNGGSASAAEILAGALKDQRRAVLVGRRTYGKGSVQTVIPLADGRALKLTTSHYATPSGAMIDGRGIDPDIELGGPDAAVSDVRQDAEVGSALAVLKRGRHGTVVRS